MYENNIFKEWYDRNTHANIVTSKMYAAIERRENDTKEQGQAQK